MSKMEESVAGTNASPSASSSTIALLLSKDPMGWKDLKESEVWSLKVSTFSVSRYPTKAVVNGGQAAMANTIKRQRQGKELTRSQGEAEIERASARARPRVRATARVRVWARQPETAPIRIMF
jgi:hypothetical protein